MRFHTAYLFIYIISGLLLLFFQQEARHGCQVEKDILQ